LRSAQAGEIPISKLTRANWTGDVAQVVEHLFALSSNPGPTKKNQKTKKLESKDYSMHVITRWENEILRLTKSQKPDTFS
jgi:hypothetical protein